MLESAPMSELVDYLLHRSRNEELLAGTDMQSVQTHDSRASADLGHAEDEVQVARIAIRLGDAEDGASSNLASGCSAS